MVQFLSINFIFLDFYNFCWVFQNFPFFVSPCISKITLASSPFSITNKKKTPSSSDVFSRKETSVIKKGIESKCKIQDAFRWSVCMSVCLYICLPERRFYPFAITFTRVYQHQRLLLRGNSFSLIRKIDFKKEEKLEWLRGGKSKPPFWDIQNSHNRRNVGNHLSPCPESTEHVFNRNCQFDI